MKSFRYVSPIELKLLSVLQTKTLGGDWYSSQKTGYGIGISGERRSVHN
jgi:hypothetical protein